MATELGHAHPHAHEHAPGAAAVPRIAWGVIAVVGVVVGVAWGLTLLTAQDYDRLMMLQLAGAQPTDAMLFLALSGVMMVAMMLPSALPTVHVYRSLAAADAGAAEARVRAVVFAAGYFVVWAVFTVLAVVVLMALGLMGSLGGAAVYAPGALLVVAGAYQLTGWKAFCLRHCRTPLGYLMGHWRSGRGGAARMGLHHAAYCLGCCWLLMLVLFVAGAMSVLWMGVFALLILGEKVWSRGEAFSRAMGFAGIAIGLLALGMAAMAPPMPAGGIDGMPMDPGMGMGM